MILSIRRKYFFLIIAAWWLLFFGLSIIGFNGLNLLNIIGFSFLIVVPGLLTVTLINRMNLDFWGYLSIVIGFSLIEIILISLIGNSILPLLGISTPLGKTILLFEISILVGVLIAINFKLNKKYEISISRYLIFNNLQDFLFAFFPVVFVILSVMGAVRLNNGGSNIFTFVMLIGIVVYSILLIIYGKRIDCNAIPIALFFISLSLLLMTSLRGWYVTGHDIQREYRVFELAKNNGIWLIGIFRDTYNACMSVTILPTVFYNLLKISDPYVFKIFFQVIFAIVPGIIYLIAKNYLSKIAAYISAVYFIAFPTFFGDMPMLNRQEIAFVFLALMLYVIFNKRLPLFVRRIFFIIFGLGMVLSHYSTTYIVVILLFFLMISRPILFRLAIYFRKKGFFFNSSISALGQDESSSKVFITMPMVICLAAASFLWSSVLTETSSNSLYRVIRETISVIRSNAKEDVRSGDVLYSLFSWRKLDQEALLKEYQKKVVSPQRLNETKNVYYDASLLGKYEIKTVDGDIMPLTPLGSFFQSRGADIASFNYKFRQASAKLLQALIVFGLIFVFFSKLFVKRSIDTDFMLLAMGSLVFILSQVLLPVLSVEYGVLRAFQQSLLFLGIFAVIGSLAVLQISFKRCHIYFAGFLVIIFFLSSTGVFTQSLGGYDPQMHLNNSGTGYDIYYLHSSEITGVDWLGELSQKDKGSVFQSEVQTDRYISKKMTSIREVKALGDIYPELIRKDSYVFLGFSNVHNERASISYKGSLIIYKYPIRLLDDNKNLIYSNKDVKIYR